MLDITLLYWMSPVSTQDVQRGFHSILASFTSPALEHVHLELRSLSSMAPSTQDMDSTDASTDAYRAQYAGLHTVLSRPIFSSLARVTVVWYNGRNRGVMSAKDVALKHLDVLRALFAPWRVRGIVSLACAIYNAVDKCLDAVVDEGKGLRSFKTPGMHFNRQKLFAALGL